MEKGLVSCVIPTYKRSDSLIRAINSVLNQSYEKIEVIVVDDNNPNDEFSLRVQEKLETIKDSRVRYIQQEKHINGAAARNAGIRASKGEFIAFLDDDDEWLLNKLEKQITYLEDRPEIDAVSCLYTFYHKGKPIRKAPLYSTTDLHRKVLNRSVSIFTSTVIFRKKSLDKSGYFDESFMRHQDLQLFLDFLVINKMELLPEYLVILHIDIGGNRPNSEQIIKVKNHFFKKMNRHFELYDKKTQKEIFTAHYFEIIFVLLRERKIQMTIIYLAKIGFNPKGYLNVIRRYLERKRNKV